MRLAKLFKDELTTLNTKINFNQFQKFLVESFNRDAPHEKLIHSMFNRFKPFRIEGVRDDAYIVNEN